MFGLSDSKSQTWCIFYRRPIWKHFMRQGELKESSDIGRILRNGFTKDVTQLLPQLKNSSELQKWMDERPFGESAAVSLRVALRGVKPIFYGPEVISGDWKPVRALNAAILHLVCPERAGDLTPVLHAFLSASRISDAELAIDRHKYYEGAAARRRSRSSSSDEHFAEGVLKRSADETAIKHRHAQAKAIAAVVTAMGALSADVLLNRRRLAASAGLLSSVQPTHQRIALWDAIRSDCEHFERGEQVRSIFHKPLWGMTSAENNEPLVTSAIPFWTYWYQGFEEGRPLDWDFMADVALSEGERATASDDVSAKMIVEIELSHLRRMAYQPERVVADQESGLFRIEADRIGDPRRYRNALRKVKEDILFIEAKRGANSYTGISDIIHFVGNTIENHYDEPMYIHDDFVKAVRMIIRRIERSEIPAFDDWIENLIEDLNNASIDIRAVDVEVAKAVNDRLRIKARKPNAVEEKSLVQEIELRAVQSVRPLAMQLRADRQTICEFSPDADGEHEQALQRTANRLPQMQSTDNINSDKKVLKRITDFADAGSKIQKGAQSAEYAWSWLQYLISMF